MFDQPYTVLIFLGLAFTAGGFLVRDELLLRALVFIGTFFDIAFYVLQDPPIWGSVFTNTVLVLVNFALIIIIVVERSSLFMTKNQRKVFEQFRTLSPGQARRVNDWADWYTADRDTVLLREGEPAEKLYFIDAARFSVTKKGQPYTATGPAFAGEIVLLRGGVASATVTIPAGTRYSEWSGDRLRRAMEKSKPLENALIARFSHDLADKVRYSAPLEAMLPEES